jgi:hypothetical protein
MLCQSHYEARGRRVVDVENAVEQLSLLSARETGFVNVPLGCIPIVERLVCPAQA